MFLKNNEMCNVDIDFWSNNNMSGNETVYNVVKCTTILFNIKQSIYVKNTTKNR